MEILSSVMEFYYGPQQFHQIDNKYFENDLYQWAKKYIPHYLQKTYFALNQGILPHSLILKLFKYRLIYIVLDYSPSSLSNFKPVKFYHIDRNDIPRNGFDLIESEPDFLCQIIIRRKTKITTFFAYISILSEDIQYELISNNLKQIAIFEKIKKLSPFL